MLRPFPWPLLETPGLCNRPWGYEIPGGGPYAICVTSGEGLYPVSNPGDANLAAMIAGSLNACGAGGNLKGEIGCSAKTARVSEQETFERIVGSFRTWDIMSWSGVGTISARLNKISKLSLTHAGIEWLKASIMLGGI